MEGRRRKSGREEGHFHKNQGIWKSAIRNETISRVVQRVCQISKLSKIQLPFISIELKLFPPPWARCALSSRYLMEGWEGVLLQQRSNQELTLSSWAFLWSPAIIRPTPKTCMTSGLGRVCLASPKCPHKQNVEAWQVKSDPWARGSHPNLNGCICMYLKLENVQ